jgi:hypothetical protein
MFGLLQGKMQRMLSLERLYFGPVRKMRQQSPEHRELCRIPRLEMCGLQMGIQIGGQSVLR